MTCINNFAGQGKCGAFVFFLHKKNPFSDAVALKAKMWRQRSEGLTYTRKGKKEGNSGKKIRLFVAVAYKKGVIMCEQFDPEERFCGESYGRFIVKHFPSAFKDSANPRGKLVLQDGDPVQRSKKAEDACRSLGGSTFNIPPRSLDINPIENVFHNVRRALAEQVKELNIESETYNEFAKRVMNVIKSMPHDVIDRTIESLLKRMKMIVSSNGDRIKY